MKKDAEMTLCYPLDGVGGVLLGLKSRGLGAGYWNGFGGHVEPGEDHAFTTIRELAEECGLTTKLDWMEFRGTNTFHNPPESDYGLVKVRIYVVKRWTGVPVETPEMRPSWFSMAELPLDSMWQDDKMWLIPVLFAGMTTYGDYHFAADKTITNAEVKFFAHPDKFMGGNETKG